jgi:hypothetical protein
MHRTFDKNQREIHADMLLTELTARFVVQLHRPFLRRVQNQDVSNKADPARLRKCRNAAALFEQSDKKNGQGVKRNEKEKRQLRFREKRSWRVERKRSGITDRCCR